MEKNQVKDKFDYHAHLVNTIRRALSSNDVDTYTYAKDQYEAMYGSRPYDVVEEKVDISPGISSNLGRAALFEKKYNREIIEESTCRVRVDQGREHYGRFSWHGHIYKRQGGKFSDTGLVSIVVDGEDGCKDVYLQKHAKRVIRPRLPKSIVDRDRRYIALNSVKDFGYVDASSRSKLRDDAVKIASINSKMEVTVESIYGDADSSTR